MHIEHKLIGEEPLFEQLIPIESEMLNMLFSRLVGGGDKRESVKRIEMKNALSCGKSHIVPENYDLRLVATLMEGSKWDYLPSEILVDIIQRVEGGETSWPARKDMVSCAAVCRSWRDTVKDIVKTPEQCGLLTFPASLKQLGPRKEPIQCFIRRDRATSTFRLYLGLSPALSGDATKLLLAAKKVRKTMRTEFAMSLTSDGFSQASNTYVGKISSNFLGTKFSVYDAQPSYYPEINPIPKFCMKKVSPGVPSVVKSKVATISYELNVLRTKGPRRMHCIVNSIPSPTFPDQEPPPKSSSEKNRVILRNKVPRWHEQLQCWCLNFKGRVTVASVKNFQLALDQITQDDGDGDDDDVILQFGKIGKDIFTMDYRYPLSAFQAFAICLSSFDTKPACE